MLRKEHLPPNEACFRVPLTFTKFDLRDYLWNLYKVEVSKVRSHVRQLPLVQRVGRPNSWYRPQPHKIMIVELVKPFQWPAVPDNLSAWQKELWDMREKMIDENQEANMNVQRGEIPLQADKADDKARKELRKRAQALLAGEEKWDNDMVLDPKWEKILDESEPEKAAPYKSSSLPSEQEIKDTQNAEEKAVDSKLDAIKEENEARENEKKD